MHHAPPPPAPAVGTAVRFIGGRFNGYQGTLSKVCEAVGSVIIVFEGRGHEVVEELRHLQPLAEWRASLSPTELTIRGAP